MAGAPAVAEGAVAGAAAVVELPDWFGETARTSAEVADAVVHGVDAIVPGVPIGVGDAEIVEELVYTPRTPVPIGQDNLAYRHQLRQRRGTSATAAATTQQAGTISAEQQQLLAKRGITYIPTSWT